MQFSETCMLLDEQTILMSQVGMAVDNLIWALVGGLNVLKTIDSSASKLAYFEAHLRNFAPSAPLT